MKRFLPLIFFVACFGGGNLSPTGDITSVTPTPNMGLTGGAAVGAASLGLINTCADGQLLKSGGTGTTWTCANDNDSGGDITGVTAGTGLSGGGVTGSVTLTVNIAGASCSAGSFLSALGATGTGTCTAEVGDISGVTAGTGLSGGGTSGAVSLAVNIAGASCSAGSFVSAISATGTGTCTAGGTGTVTNIATASPLTGGPITTTGTIQLGTGDWGDIVTSGAGGAVWTIDTDAVTFAKMQNIATASFVGRTTAGTGDPENLTGTQATALLDTFSTSTTTKGLVPGANGSTGCLKGNGTWGACGITNSAGNNIVMKSDGTNAIASSITDNGSAVTTTLPFSSSSYIQAGNSVYGGGSGGRIYLSSGVGGVGIVPGLNCEYGTAATADCFINAVGAAESTTQFRNLRIQDGKNADVVTVDGPSKGVTFAGNVTANGTAHYLNGQTQFHGSQQDSYLNYAGSATYIRAPLTAGIVYLGDANTGGVQIGAATNNTQVMGLITVAGTTTLGDSGTGDSVTVKGGEFDDGGTAPSTGTCGTSPTFGGGRWAFHVTAGTGGPTTCAVNFSTAFGATPAACTVTAQGTAKAVYITALSSSAVTFSNTGGDSMSGITYHVICVGDG
jgi:hypothetical protein